eukprot:5803627-Prymnesium_polylepis.1
MKEISMASARNLRLAQLPVPLPARAPASARRVYYFLSQDHAAGCARRSTHDSPKPHELVRGCDERKG